MDSGNSLEKALDAHREIGKGQPSIVVGWKESLEYASVAEGHLLIFNNWVLLQD